MSRRIPTRGGRELHPWDHGTRHGPAEPSGGSSASSAAPSPKSSRSSSTRVRSPSRLVRVGGPRSRSSPRPCQRSSTRAAVTPAPFVPRGTAARVPFFRESFYFWEVGWIGLLLPSSAAQAPEIEPFGAPSADAPSTARRLGFGGRVRGAGSPRGATPPRWSGPGPFGPGPGRAGPSASAIPASQGDPTGSGSAPYDHYARQADPLNSSPGHPRRLPRNTPRQPHHLPPAWPSFARGGGARTAWASGGFAGREGRYTSSWGGRCVSW